MSFHFSIPAPYLNTDTAHALIAFILFLPFSFDFRTNGSLCLCSFIVFHFNFFLFDLIQFNYPQIFESFLFNLLHYFTIWESYSLTLILQGKNSTFFKPNSIPTSVLKSWTMLASDFICYILLENSFKSSKNYKRFSYILFSPFISCVYLSKNERQRYHT